MLAQVLSSDSAISSMLDMSIRMLPGDHGLPLQQVRFTFFFFFFDMSTQGHEEEGFELVTSAS
jgi:hypothetical protein